MVCCVGSVIGTYIFFRAVISDCFVVRAGPWLLYINVLFTMHVKLLPWSPSAQIAADNHDQIVDDSIKFNLIFKHLIVCLESGKFRSPCNAPVSDFDCI